MFKNLINKVKAAHDALIADMKRNSFQAREEGYNKKVDAMLHAACASTDIKQGTSSYSAWYRQMDAVRKARLNNEAAQVLH